MPLWRWALVLGWLCMARPLPLPGQAQPKNERQSAPRKPSFHKQLGYGIGLSLQNRPFLVEIQPTLGLKVHRLYSVGLAFPYVYTVNKQIQENSVRNKSNHAYGLKAFVCANPWHWILLYAESGALHYAFPKDEVLQPRRWIPELNLGLGANIPFEKQGGLYVLFLYNLLYKPAESPYNASRRLRVGLMF